MHYSTLATLSSLLATISDAQLTVRRPRIPGLVARDDIHHPTFLDSFTYNSELVAPAADRAPTFTESLQFSFHQDASSSPQILPTGRITCTRDDSEFNPQQPAEAQDQGFSCTGPDGKELDPVPLITSIQSRPLRPEINGTQPEGTNRNIRITIIVLGPTETGDISEGYQFSRDDVFSDDIFDVSNGGVAPFTIQLKEGQHLRLDENKEGRPFEGIYNP